MRRVVVTGMGIISSIGNSLDEVTQSLRDAKPGIVFAQDYADLGFREVPQDRSGGDAPDNVRREAQAWLTELRG